MFRFFAIALILGSASAHAQLYRASRYGLTPSTGYERASTYKNGCRAGIDVLLTNDGQPAEETGWVNQITRCDGQKIGWVTIEDNGAHLSPNFFEGYDLTTVYGPEKYDFTFTDLYTCLDRDSEMEGTEFKPSHDRAHDYAMLNLIMDKQLNFKITVYYNESILSGKCISKIEIVP